MKNKGFTLVELLVAISILAILTVVAIPTLRAFQTSNDKKQYESYKKALQTSGKLYNDSYGDDLFGNLDYGCQKVELTELMYKKMAKDITLKDITCNNDSKDSFVIIKKFNNEYTYQASLYCENSNHVEQYSDKDEIISDCVNNTGKPWIEVDSVNNTTNDTKKKSAVIKLLDNYGFLINQEISYAWSTSTSAPTSISSWKNYNYGNPAKKTTGQTVVLKSNSITIPNNTTGNYYLYVKPVRVINYINETITKTQRFGPFRFDHTAPSCDQIVVKPNVTVGSYSKVVKFDFSYKSSLDDLKKYSLLISYDNGNHWTTVNNNANKSFTSYVVDKDGDIRYKLVGLEDYAGNKTASCAVSGVFHRDTIPPTCNIEVNGTKSSVSNYYHVPTVFNIKSPELSTVSYGMNSKDEKNYNSKGKITVTTAGANSIYGYVKDRAGNEGKCFKSLTTTKKYTITFVGNGATPNPKTKDVYWGDNIGNLASINRHGYEFEGWYTTGGNKVSSSTKMPKENVSYYARWTPQKFDCLPGEYVKKNDISCTPCPPSSFCEGGGYIFDENIDNGNKQCPSGYTSAAGAKSQSDCYIAVSAGSYLGTKNSSTTTKCAAGTYKGGHNVYYGNTSSCTKCPSGYTSAAGATSQSDCYISVSAGNHLGTKNSSTTTKCAAGTYKGGHNVYYGNTSSCTNCPSGYTSVAGATAQSRCYMSVSAGKHVATANASSAVLCAANTYGGEHIVYYGNKSSCTNCPKNYTCPPGSTSASACKYNAKSSGGVEVVCWKDEEGWYGECDGTFPFGTTEKKSGNWKITVSEHSITFDGTNTVVHEPGRTYEFDIYTKDDYTYLGSGKQFVKAGKQSYVVISW